MDLFRTVFCFTFAAILCLRAPVHFSYLRQHSANLRAPAILATLLVVGLIMAGSGWFQTVALAIAIPCHFLYFRHLVYLNEVKRKHRLAGFVMIVIMVEPWLHSPFPAFEENWAVLLMKLGLAQVYLSAGLEKLRQSGWRWADGQALQAYLIRAHLLFDSSLAIWIAGSRKLCCILSVFTLVFELSFWTVILMPPELALAYCVLGILFHGAIQMTMRIPYLIFFGPNYLIFLPDVMKVFQSTIQPY